LKDFLVKFLFSLKILHGKGQQFIKYNVDQQKSDKTLPIAVTDRSSTLRTKNKGLLPTSLVLVRDFQLNTAQR
jgi:hypothetical protein